MIDLIPQATGLNPDGSQQDSLVRAMAARKKAQTTMSGGERLSQAASTTEPVYSKAHGYAKLLSGALGGFMQGQEAHNKAEDAKAGAKSLVQYAKSIGLREDQVPQMMGIALSNPELAATLVRQMSERSLKPDEKSWGVTGQDFMGRPQYGFINTTRGTVQPPGAASTVGSGPQMPVPPQSGGGLAPPPAAPRPSPTPGPQALVQPGAAPAQAGGAEDAARRQHLSSAGYPASAPLPPPGVDPKTYFEEWSKTQTAGQLPPKSDEVTGLRKEIQGLPSYKNMAQAAPIYRSMFEAAGRDTKAADLNIVYGLGKIMDPGSVVREGEITLANDTQGWAEKLNGFIKSIEGEGRLTPKTRLALMQEAYGRMGAYKQMFDQDTQQYRGVVERNRMNPADVLPDFGTFDRFEAAGPAVPLTLQRDIAAARQGQGAPEAAPQGGAPAPQTDDGMRQALQAELLRRQQEMAAQQADQPRYVDPMGGQY